VTDRRGHGGKRAAACLLAVILFTTLAPVARATAADDTTVEAGRKLYTNNCARCHGFNLVNPGTTYDLRRFPLDQNERFVQSVTKGKNQMPAFGDRFGAAELSALWAYIARNHRP
jgi:mono/diheme cytochrome c family protein